MGSLRKSCFVFHIFFFGFVLFCLSIGRGESVQLVEIVFFVFFVSFAELVSRLFSLCCMNPSVNYRPRIMGETENDGRK